MNVFSIILQSFLVLYFVFSGISKVIGANYWVDIFNHLGLPRWFRVVTGFVQLIGAAALIIGYWYAEPVAWAGIWLGITMVLACLAHVKVKDSFGKTAPAIVFAVINIALVLLNADHLI